MRYSKSGHLILDSNPKAPNLKDQLQKAVEVEDYEKAAEIRDRIKSGKRDCSWRVPKAP